MNPSEQLRFQTLYQALLNALARQGKAPATIDGYSRAVRRITAFFDRWNSCAIVGKTV